MLGVPPLAGKRLDVPAANGVHGLSRREAAGMGIACRQAAHPVQRYWVSGTLAGWRFGKLALFRIAAKRLLGAIPGLLGVVIVYFEASATVTRFYLANSAISSQWATFGGGVLAFRRRPPPGEHGAAGHRHAGGFLRPGRLRGPYGL